MIKACVFLNKGTVLGITADFILGTEYQLNLGLDKITELVSIISN